MQVRDEHNRRKEFISKSHHQIAFVLVKRKVLAPTQRLWKYSMVRRSNTS